MHQAVLFSAIISDLAVQHAVLLLTLLLAALNGGKIVGWLVREKQEKKGLFV